MSSQTTRQKSLTDVEESRSRLESLLPRMGGEAIGAVQDAIAANRIDPRRYNVHPDRIGGPFESVGNLFGFEAIIRRVGRPPMLIRNDKVVFEPLPLLPEVTAGDVQRMNKFIPSVGRVEFVNHYMRWGGTGFVVDEAPGGRRRVITNRHVAKLVAKRVSSGAGVFLRSPIGPLYGAKLDMREEENSPKDSDFELKVVSIVYLADDTEADVALLEIETTDKLKPAPLPLARKRAADNEPVATVGYPAFDDRNDLSQMKAYFKDLYEVKRFAPGLVITSGAGSILSHDCTTLGGNSGSCLLSFAQDAVVGLHFSGEFGIGNAAVSVETLKRIMAAKSITVKLPSLSANGDNSEARRDGEHAASVFMDRKGYQPKFLGDTLEVPWPMLSDEISKTIARPSDATSDRPFELRYTNFGILFSKARRSPMVTAVNIDGSQSVRLKRGNDKWFFDLRIDKALQLGQDSYGDPHIDRGHLVRREDPNWGELSQRANDDTFHYTNSALQHSSLNQGKALWQGLENYILESARTEGFKACVFTGPVFRDDDPELPDGTAQIPLEFWKVVVMPTDGGKLHATAYLLSQGDLIRELLEKRGRDEAYEGFLLGAYRTFQVAIAHIAGVTGLDFGMLTAADPLARKASAEAPLDEVPAYLPLEKWEDILL